MKTIFLFIFLFLSDVANGQMIQDVINDMFERIYDDVENRQDSLYIVNNICDLELCYTGVKPIKIGYPYYIDSLRWYGNYDGKEKPGTKNFEYENTYWWF